MSNAHLCVDYSRRHYLYYVYSSLHIPGDNIYIMLDLVNKTNMLVNQLELQFIALGSSLFSHNLESREYLNLSLIFFHSYIVLVVLARGDCSVCVCVSSAGI